MCFYGRFEAILSFPNYKIVKKLNLVMKMRDFAIFWCIFSRAHPQMVEINYDVTMGGGGALS